MTVDRPQPAADEGTGLPKRRWAGDTVIDMVPARVLLLCAALSACSSTAVGPETAASGDVKGSEVVPSGQDSAVPAELIRVIDGDSLELEIEGREVEVRLLGVNAPELYGPAGPGGEEADGGEAKTCNGQAAKDALSLLLEGEPLTVVGSETDRFGRLLADIKAGERSTVIDMIELGWGLATGGDPAVASDLRQRMKLAAADRAGMWGDLCGSPQELGLIIGDTQVDPPGYDQDNLVDEWVTIVNQGPAAVDLLDWEIRDDTTSHRYRLNSVLKPGQQLTVRSGTGSATEADMYLNETFPVWSNRGETVILSDPRGVVTAWAFIDQ